MFAFLPEAKIGEASCCGARQPFRLQKQARVLPTAATRSPPFICHRQRLGRSPVFALVAAICHRHIAIISFKSPSRPKKIHTKRCGSFLAE